MELNHKELLTKAKVILQAEQPFFSYILFYCKFKPVEKDDNERGKFKLPVETMAIDKHMNVYYNPEFVEKNSLYIKGILIHEIMHVVLKHHERFEDFKDNEHEKNRMMANIAMDAVINLSLSKMNIKLMDGTIKPNRDGILEKIGEEYLDTPITVEGKSWEEVYMELKKQAKEMPNYQQDLVASDEKSKEGEGEGVTLSEEEVDNIVQEATNYAKLQGKLPGEIERLLDEVYNTSTPWQKILKQNMQSFIPFDFNYKKPNRRCYSINTFMPQQNKRPSVKIYAAVDTSGSIQSAEITYFISELFTICKQFMILEMNVLFCDAEVHSVTQIKTEKDIPKLKPLGGGGTSFRPVFEKLGKEYKAGCQDILIYFTDGYGDFPDKKPSFQTIWMTTEKKPEEYPFGSIIKCNMPKNI